MRAWDWSRPRCFVASSYPGPLLSWVGFRRADAQVVIMFAQAGQHTVTPTDDGMRAENGCFLVQCYRVVHTQCRGGSRESKKNEKCKYVMNDTPPIDPTNRTPDHLLPTAPER